MRRELVVLIVIAACRREEPDATTKGRSPVIGGAPALAEKSFFRIDAKPQPPCAPGTSCEAHLVLTALGDYHVNERYPMKFVGEAAPGIEVGESTFTIDNEKTGTLTLKFRAAKPGTTRVTGTFKLSVCTEENCEIEEPKIAFDVTAS